MTVCPCLYPSIVCQAIDGDGPQNGATSRQIPDIMAAFKKKEEMMVMAQQGQAAVDHDNAEQAAEGEQEVVQQPPPPVAQIPQIDGMLSSTLSRSEGSPQADDEYDTLYGDDQPQGIQRRPQGRPMGKADKVPIWKGASAERWQEFKVSLRAWHLANWKFMTEAQAVHKVFEMFKAAGETATADSLSGNMLAGSTIPPFSDILYDIDCLFKVSRIGNGLDIVNELNFKAPTAQDAIAKIEKLSKLVTGGQVSIRDIFMAQAIKDNISDGAKIALENTMACLDREHEQVRFTEFKAAFRQTFATPPPQTHIMAKILVKITILRNITGNAGAAPVPRNARRASPGTSDLGIGPRIMPRTGGTTPTSLPITKQQVRFHVNKFPH